MSSVSAPTAGIAIGGLGLVVALSRLPFLTAPVSPDEGGFLVVGSQWGPGSSLYGAYWVDRPPLLIAVFAIADALGGAPALRLIGVLAVVAAVGAAGVIGWLGSRRRATGALAAAGAAAALLATPMFGTRIVDGELLASPLVLGGVAALLAAYGRTDPRARVLALLAGALGAGAFLVKQDMIDVFVVAGVVGGHALWRRGPRVALGELAPAALGAVLALGAVTALAAARGTSPYGLWGAVVTFRLAAAGLLGFGGARLSGLVHAYVVSGALALTLVAGIVCLRSWRGARANEPASVPLGAAAVTLTVWEVAAAAAGGSYWSHYLIGVVPGVALLVAAACRAPGRLSARLLAATLVYAALATTVSWSTSVAGSTAPSDDQLVAAYLRGTARSGDSVVVAFGHADIVQGSGLRSPYPYLWALPAFVRDPRLLVLDRLLRSPAAPSWFVAGGELSQWGRPGRVLQRLVDRRYTAVLTTTRWAVLRHIGPPRTTVKGTPAAATP